MYQPPQPHPQPPPHHPPQPQPPQPQPPPPGGGVIPVPRVVCTLETLFPVLVSVPEAEIIPVFCMIEPVVSPELTSTVSAIEPVDPTRRFPSVRIDTVSFPEIYDVPNAGTLLINVKPEDMISVIVAPEMLVGPLFTYVSV